MKTLQDVATDDVTMVAPDLLRVRAQLPFPPNEVNAWLLSGPEGWTLIDSGVNNEQTRALFERVFTDPLLGGRPVTRHLVTHFHPDHMGLAGWLCERLGVHIHTTRLEWLQARLLLADDHDAEVAQLVDHARLCGAPQEFLDYLPQRGMVYPKWVVPLPRTYMRVTEGDTWHMGGTSWQVMIGEGHAPEMICLYNAERAMLIAADQILGRISPHIGAYPGDPLANPLDAFLKSLVKFEALPEETLVLPSHGEPFQGLHARITALRAHHMERLERLMDFCATPRTAVETNSVLFRPLPLEQIGFGLSEAVAHLRYLVFSGAMERTQDGDHWLFVRR